MQTYNSFNELVADQSASPLKSDLSVFNDDTYESLKQQRDALIAQADAEVDVNKKMDLLTKAAAIVEKQAELALKEAGVV